MEGDKLDKFGSIGTLAMNKVLPAGIGFRSRQEWKHFEKEKMKKDPNTFGYVNSLRWLMRKWEMRDDAAVLSRIYVPIPLGSRLQLTLLKRVGNDDSGIRNDMNKDDESILRRMIAMASVENVHVRIRNKETNERLSETSTSISTSTSRQRQGRTKIRRNESPLRKSLLIFVND